MCSVDERSQVRMRSDSDQNQIMAKLQKEKAKRFETAYLDCNYCDFA